MDQKQNVDLTWYKMAVKILNGHARSKLTTPIGQTVTDLGLFYPSATIQFLLFPVWHHSILFKTDAISRQFSICDLGIS